jgi:hypothetical protein
VARGQRYTGDAGQLRRQALQASQTARRFCQQVMTLPRRDHRVLVAWLDTLNYRL